MGLEAHEGPASSMQVVVGRKWVASRLGESGETDVKRVKILVDGAWKKDSWDGVVGGLL